MFGVEAVLAGVLVAGLGAALGLGLFVLIAAEVIEGSLGGFFGAWESVEEFSHFFAYFFHVFHGGRVAGGGDLGQGKVGTVGERGSASAARSFDSASLRSEFGESVVGREEQGLVSNQPLRVKDLYDGGGSGMGPRMREDNGGGGDLWQWEDGTLGGGRGA